MDGAGTRVLVIAEAGVNHNGSLDRALALVDAAAEAGADVVKFQTFQADKGISARAPKAEYQIARTGEGESQLEMARKLELDEAAHICLLDRCQARGVTFLSTPFDLDSLSLLHHRLDLPRLKIGSGEVTNAPLLFAAARTGKPIILSTGMATLEETAAALGVLAYGYLGGEMPERRAFLEAFDSPEGRRNLEERVTLLHCVTAYPTPVEDVNLRAMDTLSEAFGLPIGLSDHTEGTAIALAAAGRGALLIEKHLTLDRGLPGPDHKASLEPLEFGAMVAGIRQIERALGRGGKEPAPSEQGNLLVARKSLVAARAIRKDEIFRAENLTVKRPAGGRSPFDYWAFLGRAAKRDYQEDDLIE